MQRTSEKIHSAPGAPAHVYGTGPEAEASAKHFYDVSQIHAALVADRAGLISRIAERQQRNPLGALTYFIQAVEGGPIKIGQSANPMRRRTNLQIGYPSVLRILAVTREAESLIHERFNSLRLRGEWFQPHPELVAFIDQVRADA